MDAPTPLHARTVAQEVFAHFITFAHLFRAFVLSLMALLRRIAMYIPLKAKVSPLRNATHQTSNIATMTGKRAHILTSAPLPQQLSNPSLSLKVSDSFSLDAAGLVALADLTTVQ